MAKFSAGDKVVAKLRGPQDPLKPVDAFELEEGRITHVCDPERHGGHQRYHVHFGKMGRQMDVAEEDLELQPAQEAHATAPPPPTS